MNLKGARIALAVQLLTAVCASLDDPTPISDQTNTSVLNAENGTLSALSSASEDPQLCQKKSNLHFDSEVRFGEPITVHFCNPQEPSDDEVPWIGIFKDKARLDMKRMPRTSLVHAWLNDCNSQSECLERTKAGVVEFSAKDPASSWYNNFPLHTGTYRICFAKEVWKETLINDSGSAQRWDVDHTHKLIGKCKQLVVLPTKDKMTRQAKVKSANGRYFVGDDIIAMFDSPVPVPNQWIGVYEKNGTKKHGGPPEGNLMCKSHLWAYAGCGNQEGDQLESRSCAERKKSGIVRMNETNLDNDPVCEAKQWPIPPGKYYLCLNFHNYEPFTEYKCSKKEFVIKKRRRKKDKKRRTSRRRQKRTTSRIRHKRRQK